MTDFITGRTEAIFREVFELAANGDVRALRQGDEHWDSLGHVSLIAALESEFAFELSIAESLEITSFESALLLVEQKLGAQ